MDSKITKSLMDSGADSMIPNIANKESAFHYCGQSGNAAVICCWTKCIKNVIFGNNYLDNLFWTNWSWKFIFGQLSWKYIFQQNYLIFTLDVNKSLNMIICMKSETFGDNCFHPFLSWWTQMYSYIRIRWRVVLIY